MIKRSILILLILFCYPQMLFAILEYEEISGNFTELDQGSDITAYDYSAMTATQCRDVDCTQGAPIQKNCLYKDYGTDFFNGDFEHHIAVYANAFPVGNHGFVMLYALTNTACDTWADMNSGNEGISIILYNNSGSPLLYASEHVNGVTDTSSISTGTWYYLKIVRTVGSSLLKVYIYSDFAMQTLVDTVNLDSSFDATAYRYLQVIGSAGDSNPAHYNHTATCAMDYLDINVDIDTNLEGKWKLDDWTDSSGNSNTLTDNGGITHGDGYNNIANNAALLDGTDDYLSRADGDAELEPENSMSVSAWVNLDAVEDVGIASKWSSGQESFLLAVDDDIGDSEGSARYLFSVDGTSTATVYSTTEAVASEWHNVIGVYDEVEGKLKIAVDGKWEAAIAYTGGINTSTSALEIGRYNASNTYCLDGRIDDVGVWKNRSLTTKDIEQLYNMREQFSSDSWLTGYAHRKKINLAGTEDGEIRQNYPVNFYLDSGAGTDSGQTVYINSHSSDFPNDVDFTDDRGRLLDFGFRDRSEDPITVDVKTIYNADIDQEVWMYYGKNNVALDGYVDMTVNAHAEATGVISSPKSIYFESGSQQWTIFAYMDVETIIRVLVYDHSDGSINGPYKVDDPPLGDEDLHGDVAVAIDKNDKLHIWYGAHSSALYWTRTQNPLTDADVFANGDENDWESPNNFDTDDAAGDYYTYTQAVKWSDDSVILFYRLTDNTNKNGPLCYARSASGEWDNATWATAYGTEHVSIRLIDFENYVVNGSAGDYPAVYSRGHIEVGISGTDDIHLAFLLRPCLASGGETCSSGTGTEYSRPTDLFYVWYDRSATAWKNADNPADTFGTWDPSDDSESGLPIINTDVDSDLRIIDTTDETTWLNGVWLDSTGKPYVVYTRENSGSYEFSVSEYSSDQWNTKIIESGSSEVYTKGDLEILSTKQAVVYSGRGIFSCIDFGVGINSSNWYEIENFGDYGQYAPKIVQDYDEEAKFALLKLAGGVYTSYQGVGADYQDCAPSTLAVYGKGTAKTRAKESNVYHLLENGEKNRFSYWDIDPDDCDVTDGKIEVISTSPTPNTGSGAWKISKLDTNNYRAFTYTSGNLSYGRIDFAFYADNTTLAHYFASEDTGGGDNYLPFYLRFDIDGSVDAYYNSTWTQLSDDVGGGHSWTWSTSTWHFFSIWWNSDDDHTYIARTVSGTTTFAQASGSPTDIKKAAYEPVNIFKAAYAGGSGTQSFVLDDVVSRKCIPSISGVTFTDVTISSVDSEEDSPLLGGYSGKGFYRSISRGIMR